jgi:DNA repair protein RAD7
LDIEVALDSDHLESEDEVPTGRRRKVSQAALEKQKAAAKKRAKKNKDDDDYEDGEDEYTALSKSFWTSKPGNAKPSVGSLEKCAKCSKQFTVVRSVVIMWRISYLLCFVKTKYTMAADPPPGYLCHPCVKASGTDPFKKPRAPPRKRKSAAEKRNVVNYQEKKFPTLVSLCIKVCVIVPWFLP